jgi:LysR family transcriptional activator of nhaA
MDYLNFHHLRYFWMVAKEGGVRRAAEKMHVSQPSISAQLKLLEESLGEELFRRSGRALVLSEAGQLVFSYAEEIFAAGRELMSAVKQRPGLRGLRLQVGLTDGLSKLIAFEILKPVFRLSIPIHVVCREGELRLLVEDLAAHRLDLVLADEPASSSLKAKAFNHLLGRSSITLCAAPALAQKLRAGFPRSLHDAPALLPSGNMGMRSVLEKWFDGHGIRPRLVGEFEDAALMEVAASSGLGFTAVHTIVGRAACKRSGLKAIARLEECGSDFYAITARRLVKHPGALAITQHTYSQLFG